MSTVENRSPAVSDKEHRSALLAVERSMRAVVGDEAFLTLVLMNFDDSLRALHEAGGSSEVIDCLDFLGVAVRTMADHFRLLREEKP